MGFVLARAVRPPAPCADQHVINFTALPHEWKLYRCSCGELAAYLRSGGQYVVEHYYGFWARDTSPRVLAEAEWIREDTNESA